MITVVTATRLEYDSARKALPRSITIVHAGISMRRKRERVAGSAISCGLAGGLRTDLPTGTVVIPRTVRRPDGTIVTCDALISDALVAAARSLGHEPVDAPVVTSETLLHGSRRKHWADQGFAAADMESGLIEAERLACVRVILDTPHNEISPAWEKPASVLFHPRAWRELPFLIREGPRCARLAAAIIASAVRSSSIQ